MNVLISGASRGIGLALCKQYAANTDKVFITARNEEQLKEASATGDNIAYAVCDVRDNDSVSSAVSAAIEYMGKIDIAILNAGVGIGVPIADLNTGDLEEVFNVNLFGVARFMEYLIPQMKSAGGGTIAPVGSLADSAGFPGSSGYCASKIALARLSFAASIELEQFDIKICHIRPGYVKTDMTANNKQTMPFLMEAEKAAKIIARGISRGRRVITFPWQMRIISALMGLVPEALFRANLRAWYRKSKM